ncbi:hypothetical protein Tco_0123318, partial [Tanacetum coccineum]
YHQATVLEAEKDKEILRLKTTPPKFSSFFRVRKFLAFDEFSRVQGELLSLAASAGFERVLSMHQTKDEFAAVLKKMVNFMPDAQDRLAEASPLVAQTDYSFLNKISKHATEPLSVILQLEPKKLVRSANVLASRELSVNANFTASVVASEHNKEMVNVEVDGSDPNLTDDTAIVTSGHAFVQGISVALDDVVALLEVGSGRISTGPNDVVVALSAHEKGDGLDPTSAAGERLLLTPLGGAWYAGEHLLLQAWGKLTVDVLLSIQQIPSHATRPRPNGFNLGTCSIAGQASVEFDFTMMGYIVLLDIRYDYKSVQLLPLASRLQFGFVTGALLVAFPFLLLPFSSTDGLVLIPTDTSWLRNSSFIVANPVNTSTFGFRIFGRRVIRNLWNVVVASIISSLYFLSCSVALLAASPANNVSQSMTWLDALNFKWMVNECILSSGLTRIIPTPEPSSIISLPKYNRQALGAGVDFA